MELTRDIILSQITQSTNHSGTLDLSAIYQVISDASSILEHEPAFLELQGQFTIVGDIHGDIDSLLRIFDLHGYPPATRYLFLGDYVDRGRHSVHVISLLYALKTVYPTFIYLLKGNHEELRECNREFITECRTYSNDLYETFFDSFQHLPVGAIINETTFCVHGGIAPGITDRESLFAIGKNAHDILWSDPSPTIESFSPSPRGTSYQFGHTVFQQFLNDCGFSLLIRAHELCDRGYSRPFGPTGNLLTVFSSANYCDNYNYAATVTLTSSQAQLTCFKPLMMSMQKLHRYTLPEFILQMPQDDTGLLEMPKLEFIGQLVSA